MCYQPRIRVTKILAISGFIGLLLCVTMNSYAHHAAAPNFHADREITVSGVVTELKFVNPHSYIYFNVTDQSGDVVEWRCETQPASRLRQSGWTAESLVPGDAVTITGAPGRREDNLCSLHEALLTDGTALSSSGIVTSAGTQVEATTATTQSEATPTRPAYLANGQPNLSGPWTHDRRAGQRGRRGGGEATQRRETGADAPEPTAAAIREAEGFVFEFDNPALRCHPANIVFAWYFEHESNEIHQYDDRVVLQYGYLDLVRTIHLDQSEHPDNIVPSVEGHSVGWWEGDTLVIDTIGFEPGVYAPPATQAGDGNGMHSTELHVVERFELGVGGDTLIREYTAEDSLYFQKPHSGRDIGFRTTIPYASYDCTELSGENNQRPGE